MAAVAQGAMGTPSRADACRGDDPRKGRARYTRDPHQTVPPDCGFVRFRTPGGVLFTSAGLVKFRTREEGVTACQAFAACSAAPMEVQMHFPHAAPHTFASPRFAAAQAVTQSRWHRWTRALGIGRH
jgi:hypothetical protein